jgi:hypothetical protein
LHGLGKGDRCEANRQEKAESEDQKQTEDVHGWPSRAQNLTHNATYMPPRKLQRILSWRSELRKPQTGRRTEGAPGNNSPGNLLRLTAS